MTSLSLQTTTINLLFFRDAAAVYGKIGLTCSTNGAAGFDLRACPELQEPIVILPGERRSISTGIAVEPPHADMAGFVYSRSGLGAVKGLTVAQGVGVIDSDYRGEIVVFLLNTDHQPQTVMPGERIAQIVYQPIIRPVFTVVGALSDTDRGGGGFGHTGSL